MKRPFTFQYSSIAKPLLTLVAVSAISACGQKGPLYLPEQPDVTIKSQPVKKQKETGTQDASNQTDAAGQSSKEKDKKF